MGKMGLINIGFLGFMFMSSLILCKAQVPSTSLEYNFVLEESYFQRHCTNKSMLTVNRSFPGPEIRVHKGDTVKVHVQNNGDYGVTIHWHGVKQPRNPWSDGPEAVTQCLIQSGSNFTQEIIFSDEEGTLWWHAHSDWTRATVHGAIAILPDDDTYPFSTQPDGEETLVLASWYDEDVMTVYDQAANYTEPDVSDAFTINGLIGNYTSSCSNDGVYTTDFPLGPNGTLSNGTRVIMLNLSEVVEIVFQGTDDGAEDHPMHVHGHSFYLLGSGAGTNTTVYYNETTDSDSLNLADPPLLNTVSVPKYGWAVIRFVANNPGVWFIHCHLERHVTWGMATALIVGNGTTVETSMLASPKMPTC
ncbi:hypothetical protein L1049_021181 [Liquidambar formosana]|uniref:Laccase n=1 Tax=Liquidambar formosana TaxID=63359 RepID=A0AAP0SDQ7_LIQFO